ncbi:MAG: DUF3343 domain-containing protein [Clostridia bacterium]
MSDSFGIAAFRSRQQVLRFESSLKRAGLHAQVVATPRDVAIGCGLSVQFALPETERVMDVYRRAAPSNLIGFYRVDRYAQGKSNLTPLLQPRGIGTIVE